MDKTCLKPTLSKPPEIALGFCKQISEDLRISVCEGDPKLATHSIEFIMEVNVFILFVFFIWALWQLPQYGLVLVLDSIANFNIKSENVSCYFS